MNKKIICTCFTIFNIAIGSLLFVNSAQEFKATYIAKNYLTTCSFNKQTYGNIFCQNNLVPIGNLFSDNDFNKAFKANAWAANVPVPLYKESGGFVTESCIEIDKNVSQQAYTPISFQNGHNYYLACKAKCTDYVTGTLGFNTNINSGNDTFGLTSVSDWTTVSKIYNSTRAQTINLFVGSITSANLKGFIDSIVCVDLTSLFETQPSKDDLDATYNNFCRLVIEGLISETNLADFSFTDTKAKNLFMSYLNEDVKTFGLTNSKYYSSSGYVFNNQTNLTTAEDVTKATWYGQTLKPLADAWGTNSYTVNCKNGAKYIIASTVVDHDGWANVLKTKYTILGGKTGSWGSVCNYGINLTNNETKETYTIALSMETSETSSKNRFVFAKNLMDVVELLESKGISKIENSDDIQDEETRTAVKQIETNVLFKTSLYKNARFAVTKMPKTFSKDNKVDDYLIYGHNKSTKFNAASLTKMVTAITMVELQKDLSETFTFNSTDITGGSGPSIKVGDKITFTDSLYLMMLPSSNTTAEAIGRVMGYKLHKAVQN